ncbi:MAG TPA: TM2 domain-containing protein [Spirochaetota bacterium]|nr:TM2 domain-containing protein [Spirochaetota bacterium]HOS41802.1 TM2 domain-containing protein [Spirochaetota bacterium]HPU88421.1 TM2 domain-containing protein [Spirochaetota bacterium]
MAFALEKMLENEAHAVYRSAMEEKSKYTAGLLAMFLGIFGAHKFYLGSHLQGALYLLFIWTAVPMVLSFIDAVQLLTMDDATFAKKYLGT